MSVGFEETQNIFTITQATDQLMNFPKTKFYEAKNIDCVVNIRAPLNKKSLSNADSKENQSKEHRLKGHSGNHRERKTLDTL